MRFRTDRWHYADLKANGWTWEQYAKCFHDSEDVAAIKIEWDAVPPAQKGDVWRIFWHHEEAPGKQLNDRIAGYAICCIICGKVHAWTSARNCSQKVKRSYVDSSGKTVEYDSCVHSGLASCWIWTGSAEAGTLTASPSLMVIPGPDRCNYHGWIRNGEIT